MKQVQQDGLTYLINKKEDKAKVIGYYDERSKYIIPRSIKYESHEYVIVNISESAFMNSRNIKSIEFASDSELQIIEGAAFGCSTIESIFIPPHVTKICEGAFCLCLRLQRIDIPKNSELQTIEKDAFSYTSIKSIFIPESLIDLKEGWCCRSSKLTMIKIDPKNPRYSYFEDKMIICKTTETSENYDEIAFCRRDIKEITIPSFIKTIGSCAFSDLCQLQRINIPTDSNLQTIEKEAFSFTSIESIFIPASLIDLKKGWCCRTDKLTTVIIDPKNPKYSYFEDKMIICKTTETSENYDEIVFCRRDIKEIAIPSYIKTIKSDAFSCCNQLRRIDIPTDSKLQTIEKYAFFNSSIESIFIPPNVTKICNSTFNNCEQLQRIDIPTNSKLQTIEKCAFYDSSIESIFIPHHVSKICEQAFDNCQKLKIIEIEEKSEIELNDISPIFPKDAIIMIPAK